MGRRRQQQPQRRPHRSRPRRPGAHRPGTHRQRQDLQQHGPPQGHPLSGAPVGERARPLRDGAGGVRAGAGPLGRGGHGPRDAVGYEAGGQRDGVLVPHQDHLQQGALRVQQALPRAKGQTGGARDYYLCDKHRDVHVVL
jgi:hypothetical protein